MNAVMLAASPLALPAVPSAPTSVVLSNLAYIVGAAILIMVGVVVVAVRHRKPKSVQANVDTFQRGLQALAPDSSPVRGRQPERPAVWPVDQGRSGPASSVRLRAAPGPATESDAG